MYNHVVIILLIIIKMVTIKDHIWLHDYVWTLVTRCLSHKNHILALWNARGVENKVVSASRSILVTSLRVIAFVMPTWVSDAKFLYINSRSGNSRCHLLCNMALIFAIESMKDPTFAILNTKVSTFASMATFHFTFNGGFSYIFFFCRKLLPHALLVNTTNHTPMLMHSLISHRHTLELHPSTSFHSIHPLGPFPFYLCSLVPPHSTRLTFTFNSFHINPSIPSTRFTPTSTSFHSSPFTFTPIDFHSHFNPLKPIHLHPPHSTQVLSLLVH